jgi:hypothetical protein
MSGTEHRWWSHDRPNLRLPGRSIDLGALSPPGLGMITWTAPSLMQRTRDLLAENTDGPVAIHWLADDLDCALDDRRFAAAVWRLVREKTHVVIDGTILATLAQATAWDDGLAVLLGLFTEVEPVWTYPALLTATRASEPWLRPLLVYSCRGDGGELSAETTGGPGDWAGMSFRRAAPHPPPASKDF